MILKFRFIYLLSLIFAGISVSCESSNTQISNHEASMNNDSIEKPVITNLNLDTLKGIYLGDFGGSDIRLVINYISNKHAVGYNIHKGLQRNISGSVELKDETVELLLAEPGDNEFDGVFHLSINKETLVIEGYWQSNNGKIPKKHFTLEKLSGMRERDKIEGLDKDVKLTSYNFADYFNHLSDSIGELEFNENGMCTYKYYPNFDENERREQFISFTGSWTLKQDNVIIEWQKNSVFPNRQSVFTIIKSGDSEYYYFVSLKGENRTFYMEEY